MIHIPGGTEKDSTRFHHAVQDSVQFKTYELFISGIFYLTFSDHGCSQVTETSEGETAHNGGTAVPFYTH